MFAVAIAVAGWVSARIWATLFQGLRFFQPVTTLYECALLSAIAATALCAGRFNGLGGWLWISEYVTLVALQLAVASGYLKVVCSYEQMSMDLAWRYPMMYFFFAPLGLVATASFFEWAFTRARPHIAAVFIATVLTALVSVVILPNAFNAAVRISRGEWYENGADDLHLTLFWLAVASTSVSPANRWLVRRTA